MAIGPSEGDILRGVGKDVGQGLLESKLKEKLTEKAIESVGAETALGKAFGNAGPILGGIGGALGIKDILDKFGQGNRDPLSVGLGGLQGAASGAGLGSGLSLALGLTNPITAPVAILGALLGGAGQFAKTGKHKDQKARDRARSTLQKLGIADDNFNVATQSGGQFDVGKERFDNDDFTFNVRDRGDIDFEGEIVGALNPLARLISGVGKLGTDTTGLLTNAATQGVTDFGQARGNVLDMYAKAGIDTPEKAMAAIDSLAAREGSDPNEIAAFRNGLTQLFDGTRVVNAPDQFAQQAPTVASTIGLPTGRNPLDDRFASAIENAGGFTSGGLGNLDQLRNSGVKIAPDIGFTKDIKDVTPGSLADIFASFGHPAKQDSGIPTDANGPIDFANLDLTNAVNL